ncbi:MAG: GAF domain-containing protein [Thermoleophilaceae bacterium]
MPSPAEGAQPDRRSDDELRRRLAQQAAVAELGRLAMAGTESRALAARAAELVAGELGVPYVMLLTPIRDGGLSVWAHHGMPAAFDRLAALPQGHGSQARYTLEVGEAVVSRELENEDRFTPSPGLLAHGGRSAATVPVGVSGRPLGVLATASRRADDFSDDDVNFLQAIANLLGAAVERERAEAEIRAEHERLEEALRQASEGRPASGSWPTRLPCSSGRRTPTAWSTSSTAAGSSTPAERGGDRGFLGAGRAPRRPGGCRHDLAARAAKARALGTRVPVAPPRRRVPVDRRPRGPPLGRRPAARLRGHGNRHPRAQGDRAEAQRGLRARSRGGRDPPALVAARAPPPDRRGRLGGPLPAGQSQRRDRRGLVRRDRARGRPGRRGGGRRGRPRPAGRGGHGPDENRLPGLRAARGLAGRDARAAQPAPDEGERGPDGHGALPAPGPRHR